MPTSEKSPELKDIQEAISRYIAANKGNVVFVASFIAFDPKANKKTDNFLLSDKSQIFALGKLAIVRYLLNDLRDIIEEESKDGVVNI